MFKFKLVLLGLVLYCFVLIKCNNDLYCLNHISCFDSKGEEDFVAPCLRNHAPDIIGSFCETTVLSSYYTYDQCIPTDCLASVKNYCSTHPCQNSGLCFQMFGSYSCQCQTKFHGRNCEHRLEEDMNFMHDVYFIFNKFTTTKKKNLLYIFFRKPGDDMKMIFSAGDSGEVFEINELQMRAVDNGHAQCIERKLKEHQCRYIPKEPILYKSIRFEVVFSLEGTIIMEYYPKPIIPVPGFKVNQLSVTIFNKQYQEFSGEFNQLVSYRNEICPIQVVITENCGSRSDKPLQIKRNDDRIIVSSLKKYKLTSDECLNQLIDYKWTVFAIRRRLLKHIVLPEKTTTGVDEYKIDKFTFPIGLYKVKLTVFLSGIKSMKEYSTFYSGLCFFEVLKVPLKIEIKGGDSRSVQPFEPFSLDGSASYDPNEPRDYQSNLIWKWNCNGTEEFCKDHLTENGIYQFQDGLPAGIWTFTLTLTTIDEPNISVAASQTIYSLNFQTQIEINCLKNCGIGGFKTNTKEIVYLEANVLNNKEEVELLWTVSHESDEFNAAEIAETSVKSNILIIKENVLEADSEYTFKVRPSNILLNGVSSITISTNKGPDGGTCNVTPQEGIMADTKFHIACVNFTVHDELTQLRYEFYQGDLEQEQPGTMFGHSISGELKNVLLTKQRIIVRIVDEYGMYKEVSLNVNLHERQPSTLDIEKYLRILNMEKQFVDSGSRAIIAGVVLDVMANVPDKLRVIKLLLESLSKERTNSFTDIKMYTSVLRKIVKVGVYQVVNGIDSSAVQSMGALMLSLTKSMLNITSTIDKKEAVIILDDIKSITLTMLSCSDVIVNSKDETIFDSSSSNRATFSVHERFKKGTSSMIEALHLSGKAILASLLPHEKEVVLKEIDSTMWLKVENPEMLSNISEIPQLSTTNIRIKKGLAKLLQGRSENIAAKVVLFNKNPFWWDLKEHEISSEIISVTFWERSEMKKLITDVPDPLDIFFKLNDTKYEIISGTIFNDIHSDNNDSLVAVHVIEATPENSNGKLFVEFIDLGSNELRVMLSENFRPDYDSMINDSHIVSAKHSRLSLSYENISANTLHFIGILPGANSLISQTVSYTFKVYIAECKLRYPTMWISTACKIGEETSEDYVHCRCSHLSFFGSGIFVSPNKVNPIQDLSLFLTLVDNPLVFVIVVSLLLIYVALLILLNVKEKRNRLKGRAIVLEDNIPGDLFCYLLVVHTSFNIGSGTSSNVGIRLHGAGSKQSRPHILRSGVRQVLRRSADDWFLLFTKEHLGDLEKIEIWHDNTGPHPDWCCKKILVYDVTTKDQYTFMVEKWFSVRPGESLTAEIFALESGEYSDWKKTITHNFVHHFQENHLWASILFSHPRAIIPKTQRLTIAWCIIFLTLLTGVMFYGVTKGHIQEDDPIYTISLREIVLIIECTLISGLTSRLVEFCFAKSNRLIQHSDVVTEQFPKDRNNFNVIYKYMLDSSSYIRKAIKNMIRGKPLIPILVGKDTHTTVVRQRCWKKAGWILSQAIIWISAYFIILYGLKLGKVRSELWITSIVFSITKSVFVTQPLKLIIFSIILGILFKEEYAVDDCESDIDVVIKRRSFEDKLILSDLKWVDYSSEYCPLTKIKTADYQKLYLKKVKLSHIFQSIVTVLLLIMLMYLTTQRWVGANHWNNSHISIILSRSLRSHESSLEEVDSEIELIGYLITNWIPNIFKGRWYNRRVNLTSADESFPECGWFVDANHRLVGMPRLRQIRVIQERCSFFLFNKKNKSSYCFPAMKESTFDTGSYGLEWNKLDKYVNKPFLVPWTFQSESDGLMVYGQSGTVYPGGGYVALLKNTQRACASMISDLRDLHWWDCHSRALISEFSLYNPNSKTLTTVITITEHLPSGAFTNRIQTHTVQMDFNLFFGSFLFLCIITCIAVNLAFNVNRQGLFGVLENIWTCYDLVLILLSSVCMTFEWLSVFQFTKNVRSFMQDDDGFFHFSKTVLYERILQVLWFLLLVLAPIRILQLKIIVNFCKISFYTLYRKKGVLTVVSAVIICLILAQIKIINFAISPEIKPIYESKFNNRESEVIHEVNTMYNKSISSHMLALVCITATMIIKIILIKTYTIQKHSRED